MKIENRAFKNTFNKAVANYLCSKGIVISADCIKKVDCEKEEDIIYSEYTIDTGDCTVRITYVKNEKWDIYDTNLTMSEFINEL